MYPEVALAGTAGAGKSTVAQMLAEDFGVPVIEYADEIKRFCAKVLGFTEEQLWGPSEARNAVDPRFAPGPGWEFGSHWEDAEKRVIRFGKAWVSETFPTWPATMSPDRLRFIWFETLREESKTRGLTPRRALQTLGEWGRTIDRNVWVALAGRLSAELLEGGCRYSRSEGVVPVPGQPAPLFTVIVGARYPNEVLGTKARGGFAVLVEDTAGPDGAAGSHSSETSLALIPRSWYSGIIQNDKSRGLDFLREEAGEIVELVSGRL